MIRHIFFITILNIAVILPQTQKVSEVFILSPEAGVNIAFTDYSKNIPSFSSRLMLEYIFKRKSAMIYGSRLLYTGGILAGKDNSKEPYEFRTRYFSGGGGILFGYVYNESVIPYGYAGASYLFFNPADKNGTKLENNRNEVYKKGELNILLEAGIRIKVSSSLLLNLNGVYNFNPNDRLDDIHTGSGNDKFISVNAGFSYMFGNIEDEDGDGIEDKWDKCPGTPKGIKTDSNGCPEDEDNDGVPDYLDECPGSPAEIEVSSKGCPLDTDEDGIPDYIDRCADTPKNVEVDIFGCPEDSDEDGIYDYRDNCPDTQKGETVDSSGCPVEEKHKEVLREIIPVEPIKSVPEIHIYNYEKEFEMQNNIFSDGKEYCIQLSSWKTKAKAEREAEKYLKLGHNAFVKETIISGSKRYRVRVGFFTKIAEAEEYLKKIK